MCCAKPSASIAPSPMSKAAVYTQRTKRTKQPYQAGRKPYHTTVPTNHTRLRGGARALDPPLNLVRFVGAVVWYGWYASSCAVGTRSGCYTWHTVHIRQG